MQKGAFRLMKVPCECKSQYVMHFKWPNSNINVYNFSTNRYEVPEKLKKATNMYWEGKALFRCFVLTDYENVKFFKCEELSATGVKLSMCKYEWSDGSVWPISSPRMSLWSNITIFSASEVSGFVVLYGGWGLLYVGNTKEGAREKH